MSENPVGSFEAVCELINPLLDGVANNSIEWGEACYNANLRCEALGWTFDRFANELSSRLLNAANTN
jgi:hypothetical protein